LETETTTESNASRSRVVVVAVVVVVVVKTRDEGRRDFRFRRLPPRVERVHVIYPPSSVIGRNANDDDDPFDVRSGERAGYVGETGLRNLSFTDCRPFLDGFGFVRGQKHTGFD